MPGYAAGTAAADIAQLRRMVAEPSTATYSDALLGSVIARYPLPDISGEWPYLTSGSANTDWTATYDLARAAADVWEEKAATIANYFTFTADGATFNKEEQVRNYERQARKWNSRRAAGAITLQPWPGETLQNEWIGNINDPYE
jgi:hypothetical protein